MSRVWFANDLESIATFWRVLRRDGVTLGFTTHDRDLWFDGVLHRASPGMVPSSIRKSADFEPDSAEANGALTHDSIASEDLAAGRFDGAQVRIGLVDWDTLQSHVLYAGTIGTVAEEDGRFSADLVSRKAELQRDPVPRTSPTCRAPFCGPGCNLNPAAHTREVALSSLDTTANSALFAGGPDPALYAGGTLRWLGGPQAGIAMGVMAGDGASGLVLDAPLDAGIPAGTRALLREGCDHTLGTCSARFGNAVNFRGEPFLPGNDLLTRYPAPTS
ncbi:DUF2163 domain-containing protein [Novosphingobium mangrovi (ex Huang et al. 2023)]|uniref:DUF2163 domain-containing protein n=1 Tax=Novosphingobium mangrovi (ex Huang et al. 2023) TaxID=2976432 RepID=A0ABT2I321_9SPHN|nr:DUF2163 domain-containing protein [Novosphingobium mangrovi (ex Huang et al. 2023)]MCT2399197.1 DUF2163 domain-containing protein [Novosphingobium mangrovi (ex Huang et al. 2023)]